jgi:hypothetical protein
MELWHLSYESVMRIPSTRRYRIVLKKGELERRKADANRAAVGSARAKARKK